MSFLAIWERNTTIWVLKAAQLHVTHLIYPRMELVQHFIAMNHVLIQHIFYMKIILVPLLVLPHISHPL